VRDAEAGLTIEPVLTAVVTPDPYNLSLQMEMNNGNNFRAIAVIR